MNIAFVFGFELRIGGHFKSAAAMITHLTRMGHRVRVLAPSAIAETLELYREAGAEFVEVRGLAQRQNIPRPRLARQLIDAGDPVGEFDLYHAQDERSVPAAYLAAALSRKPHVLTIAGGTMPEKSFSRRCHTIVFSGELMDAFLERSSAWEGRLHLIRARIDTEVFREQPVGDRFVSRLDLPRHGKRVVFAMRLRENKRPWIETLLSAAESLATSGLDLRIIVAGEGELLPELRARAARILDGTGEPVVRPIGPVFQTADLVQLYNYADVIAGTGRGILEAMACGKPAIILGENGEGQIVDADSVAAAAYANFSGRHFRQHVEEPRPLPELFTTLLADETALAAVRRFSERYISEEMDARLGAEQLAQVYLQASDDPSRLAEFSAWMAGYVVEWVARGLGRRLGMRPGRKGRSANAKFDWKRPMLKADGRPER